MRSRPRGLGAVWGLVALIVGAPAAADPARAADAAGLAADADFSRPADLSPTAIQERRLIQGLIDVRHGRLDDALRNVTRLVRQQPDFGLAQLVYGDLLLASTGQLAGFGHRLGEETLADYRHEARARLYRYLAAPPVNSVPDTVLRHPPGSPPAIVVDLDRYRMFLFENRDQRLTRTRDFYISIGKGGVDKRREGDEKTPVGVYRVSSFLPGRKLPDMYGEGAYPLDYPNGWDRRLGRTGSGIWIHGTETDRYSRPPLSSEGCVTLANEDFRTLMGGVEVEETTVVVADGVRWISEDQARADRRLIEGVVDAWRRDWESLDTESYLAHYSSDFKTGGMNRAAFAKHKRRVNRHKRYIRVGIEDLGIYRYPGEPDLVLVSFLQRYSSDNFTASRRKNQYWRREAGQWRIVLEESV